MNKVSIYEQLQCMLDANIPLFQFDFVISPLVLVFRSKVYCFDEIIFKPLHTFKLISADTRIKEPLEKSIFLSKGFLMKISTKR